jgi:hypothetical protein
MQTFEYFARYNTRITFETDASGEGGTAITGAASTIVTANLTPNRVMITTAGGKAEAHDTVTPTILGYVDIGSSLTGLLGGKEPTLAKGNLTETSSDVLNIVGGTGAVIGSGLTIEVVQATTSTSGYLSSTDWNTFNNKLSTTLTSARIFVGNGSNVATGVAMSGVIAITNAGVTSIVDGSIVDADIHASAAIARTKIASGTNYRILANSATGVMSENAALTAGRVIVSDSNGQLVHATTTTAQINFLSTTTSDVQVQLSTLIVGKATNALVQAPGAGQAGYAITWDNTASEYTLTDPVVQGIPTAGTTGQIIVKDSVADFDCSWQTPVIAHITDISALAADINLLAGAAAVGVLTTDIQNLLGTDSNIQDQLDGKQSSSLAQNAIWVGNSSGLAAAIAGGTNGYVLTSVSGTPTWQPVSVGSPPGVDTQMIFNDAGAFGVDAGFAYNKTTNTLTVANLETATTIGGAGIYRAGGTDVALADGGTGAGLADPGADRIMFWDESANAVTWLTVSTGLSISGTDLTATGGGGITNAAAANELMKSDGTNAVTSGLFTSTNGNITLGSASISGDRTIASSNTATTASLTISSQNILYLNSTTNIQINPRSSQGFVGVDWSAAGLTGTIVTIGTVNAHAQLRSQDGSTGDGGNLYIYTGAGGAGGDGNNNSGSIYFDLGTKQGTGTVGNIGFFTTAGSFGSGEKVMFIGNATTNATSAPTNGIIIHAKDSSAGSSNSTVAIYTEQAVEVIGTFTASHKLRVWINNTEYYIQLDAV